ncbi:LysR family transcriptional regulator [Shimia sp. Alg240-R146]|uniref:LysR family transcriptional regulator n=1 Tax=Shimia sp. Alg240-R146 TaxID=2993449 RepID=UPI0022E51F03|nr:LysR family transcriptional regulator [Shimia sp. Alg240-R146]
MLIDPRHLEQLAVIVENGTLQLAAKKIGTSQPALSRMIRTLEARIGMPLFERSTRPLTPTDIGFELSQQGQAVRSARLRAAEVIDLGAEGFAGVLKIGAPPFLCKSLMSEAIAGFLSARSNIRIDLIPDYHAGLMERIYLNQIDVIVGPSKFVDRGDSDLIVDLLFSDANVIVGRIAHPVISLPNPVTADFAEVIWVGHSERSILRTDMEDALRQMGVKSPRIAFQSESAGAVLALLRETDFMTVLPSYALRPDGSDGLSVAKMSLPKETQDVSMITLAQRAETKLVSDFKAHLRDRVSARFGNVLL